MNGSVDYTTANKTTDIRRVSTFGLTTFLLTAIFLLPVGVIGNLMVIVVVRKRRYLQTKTNFLLANLAACGKYSWLHMGSSVRFSHSKHDPGCYNLQD